MKRTDKRTITRRDLYEPFSSVRCGRSPQEFGLSGNGLAKLCRREGIPVPERGYWAKLEHGKRVKKPALSSAVSGREMLPIEATASKGAALEDSMPAPLAALLRAEREASEPIPIPKAPKPHGFIEMWPKSPARGQTYLELGGVTVAALRSCSSLGGRKGEVGKAYTSSKDVRRKHA